MPDSKTLLDIFESLDEQRQSSLIDYAGYLQSKGGLVSQEVGEPMAIPRPTDETVVGAIKRLKETYPMIESMSVFSAASSLMTEHMVQGRDAVEVIDDIQILFHEAYIKLKEE